MLMVLGKALNPKKLLKAVPMVYIYICVCVCVCVCVYGGIHGLVRVLMGRCAGFFLHREHLGARLIRFPERLRQKKVSDGKIKKNHR